MLEDSLIEIDEKLKESFKPICMADEFSVYAYPEGADGKATKEAPLKVYDHAMDALRYGVMYLDRYSMADKLIDFA